MKKSLIISFLLCVVLLMNACATFKKPSIVDHDPVASRALTKSSHGIRASVAIAADDEAGKIFGVDLARENIQAVWLEIENKTGEPVILLPTAIDPDYFSPLEVAYIFHSSFASDSNAELDDHLLALSFPVRSLIQPGTQVSGYVFTNMDLGTKVIDVDLLGSDLSRNFTFFIPVPGSAKAEALLERMETMFSEAELNHKDDPAALRRALEQLPCCVSIEPDGPEAEPLNVVIIGKLDDWTTAFIRRGYLYQGFNARYVFGRTQDLSAAKRSRGLIQNQIHTLRVWQTPLRHKGKPVWVGQTSARLGGRFAVIVAREKTVPISPYVDESRNDISQDLAYSQTLVKVGYVKSPVRSNASPKNGSRETTHYHTDGLRVVLEFGDRPTSLTGITFFDWERLADY